MSYLKLLFAIGIVFLTMWVTDSLIHGVLLKPAYTATAHFWRPEAEMRAHWPWMLAGQFLVAAAFTTLYAKAFAERACLKTAIGYALCMGLFHGGGNLIMYAVEPYPGVLVAKWILAGLAQSIVLGLVVFRMCGSTEE